MYFVYMVSIVIQGFFVQVFFDRTKIGAVAAAVWYYLCYIIYQITSQPGSPMSSRMASSILSQTAMTYIANVFLQAEVN